MIGAPGLYLTGNVMRRHWVGQSQLGDGAIPVEKLPLLAKLVYEKCDPVDGVNDGIIDNPRRCDFKPSRDVPKCAGADLADCFTAGQIEALGKIYGGHAIPKASSCSPANLWAAKLPTPVAAMDRA